ncbi:MAG TPA: cation:proton antiporter [Methanoregulaceae archaeon]|nr:cation:proton antiporter [Methanoregulaceae archaeon]
MEGLVIALFICLVLLIITKYWSWPVIPFYILAGIALGTSGLKLVAPDAISAFLSELGLIFLLFYMGLEIKPDRILSNQKTFFSSGIIDLNINLVIGFVASYALGFSLQESLVIASAFFISSTAMAVASLIENKKLLMRESETIVWMMVFEDIVLIIFLTLLSTSMSNPLFLIGKLAAVLFLFYVVTRYGKRWIQKVINREDELPVFLTFSAVICIAFVSQAIGLPETLMVIAFGAALASTDPRSFELQARPFKDVFLIIFFVFFGIGVDFSGGFPLFVIVAISALAIASKLVSGLIIGRVVHGQAGSGVEIWANTIGRGEFSIALASLYGSAVVSAAIAAMVIITSVIGSFTAKYSGTFSRLFDKARNKNKPSNGTMVN